MRLPQRLRPPSLAQVVVGDAFRLLHLLAYLRYRAFGTTWEKE